MALITQRKIHRVAAPIPRRTGVVYVDAFIRLDVAAMRAALTNEQLEAVMGGITKVLTAIDPTSPRDGGP